MQEQENKEKVLQMINLYAVNKYLEKMIVTKTKKLTLKDVDGNDFDLMLLQELTNLTTLEKSSN